MPEYIGLPIETNVEDLTAIAYDYLQAKVPGWQPNAGNIDTWLIEAAALWAADLRESLTEQTTALFRYFGSSLMGVLPVPSSPATVTVSVTAKDNLGYVMPAGTTIGFVTPQGDLYTFYTAAALNIATGSVSGSVTLIATENGSSSSNLGGTGQAMQMVDPLDWVTTVIMQGATTGGADAESDDDYLSRLTGQLQLMTPRPILPADFAALALNVPGVARALAIDGYNPADTTYNNARMVTIASLDNSGNPVGSSIKASVQSYLDSLREVNFIVNTIDPTTTGIDVNFSVKVLPGRVPTDIQAAVITALQGYLSSISWGTSESSLGNWSPQPNVRLYEIATVINGVDGVDYISGLTIGLSGGAQGTVDVVLPGAAPLAAAGSITGSAS